MTITIILRHLGPGPHPAGSPQSVHGKKGEGLAVHEDAPAYGGDPEANTDIMNTKFLVDGLGIKSVKEARINNELRVQAKKEIQAELAKRTGVDPQLVRAFIGKWSNVCSDHDAEALSIQRDAAELFGRPLGKWLENEGKDIESDPMLPNEDQKALLTAMKDWTAERMAQCGLKPDDTVRLYRIVGLENGDISRMKAGQEVMFEGNPLESWTSHAGIRQIAGGFFGRPGRDVIMHADIPVKDIVASARTGFGCLTESEFVVSRKDYKVRIDAIE